MTCILAISNVSRFYLASVAEQAGLNLIWSKITEDMFSRDVAQIIKIMFTLTVNDLIIPVMFIVVATVPAIC